MVDRYTAMRFCPCLCSCVGIRNEWRKPRIGNLIADDRRIEFAVEKHLHQHLAFRRAYNKIGVLKFDKVRILKCNPTDFRGINTVVVTKQAKDRKSVGK